MLSVPHIFLFYRKKMHCERGCVTDALLSAKYIFPIRKDIFACLFSIHNTISLSCHEQVCLSGLRFERYFSHHRAQWWEKYLSKRSPLKHTCLWHDKLIVLYFSCLSFNTKHSRERPCKLESIKCWFKEKKKQNSGKHMRSHQMILSLNDWFCKIDKLLHLLLTKAFFGLLDGYFY